MERCDVTAFLPVHSFARACDCRAERIIHKLTLTVEMVESWKAGNVEKWKDRKLNCRKVERWKVGKVESLKIKDGKVERWKYEKWKGLHVNFGRRKSGKFDGRKVESGKAGKFKGGKVETWKEGKAVQ
jgi:hypothetical protein